MPQIPPAIARPVLITEFLVFFILAPAVMAIFLPPGWMFYMLGGLCVVGLTFLAMTPGFHWRELFGNAFRINWRFLFVCLAATALISYTIVHLTRPEASFVLIRERPHVMLVIILFYPLISALPQELIYRVLFYRRYRSLFGSERSALIINAAVFSFAHLMYWSLTVLGLTFLAGLAFAYAYRHHRSFGEALLLHALAGIILFAFGMGVYFYSGNVVRPF